MKKKTGIKRPAYQFYPGDWLHDTALRTCSLAARGLWIDMNCIMHQGVPYGHLTLPSKDAKKDIPRSILPPALARMVGSTEEEVSALLRELEEAGVFSRTPEDVIYSRRMVRDEKTRESRVMGGFKSLEHPNVPRPKSRGKDIHGQFSRGSLGGSPSSSSSSSKLGKKKSSKRSEPDLEFQHPSRVISLDEIRAGKRGNGL